MDPIIAFVPGGGYWQICVRSTDFVKSARDLRVLRPVFRINSFPQGELTAKGEQPRLRLSQKMR
jgi:hypothetical protein